MFNTLKVIGVVVLLGTSSLQPAAASGSMRCGTHIISSGQGNSPGQYEVLKRCGEPDFRQGDTWVYKKSSSVAGKIRFDRDGNIVSID
jgi:hypothetical protein